MKKRWIAAGMIVAQRNFIRIKGYAHMSQLSAALAQHVLSLAEEIDNQRTGMIA